MSRISGPWVPQGALKAPLGSMEWSGCRDTKTLTGDRTDQSVRMGILRTAPKIIINHLLIFDVIPASKQKTAVSGHLPDSG